MTTEQPSKSDEERVERVLRAYIGFDENVCGDLVYYVDREGLAAGIRALLRDVRKEENAGCALAGYDAVCDTCPHDHEQMIVEHAQAVEEKIRARLTAQDAGEA